MVRYILVDDSPSTLKNVKAKIDKISKDYNLQHIKSYSSSLKAAEQIKQEDFDVLIVDFEMPVYNGIELAKKIATNKKIIFLTSTTNNEKLVINSLDISGFLSKPFDIDDFQIILKNKIIGQSNNSSIIKNPEYITLHIGKNKDLRFKAKELYYISTASFNLDIAKPKKNCVHIYGKNDELLKKDVCKSIIELDEQLDIYNFKKISQSTIINMEHIKERDNTNISLFDTKESFIITDKEKRGFVAKLRNKLGF
ncbi:LytTR family DNA-binding domain-containing protein [Polaribacter sp. 20A6]|uniref:LytR/AlgR family response regulator transcription factor n=1 Tax=Polaribacter sp. 20A6 TaxID=2687289 RepID=UPI0013FDBEE7|nr:response regulator [Polaribacter sp. 20A6]